MMMHVQESWPSVIMNVEDLTQSAEKNQCHEQGIAGASGATDPWFISSGVALVHLMHMETHEECSRRQDREIHTVSV